MTDNNGITLKPRKIKEHLKPRETDPVLNDENYSYIDSKENSRVYLGYTREIDEEENNKDEIQNKYLNEIFNDMIGIKEKIITPFGFSKIIVYCDFTASGKALKNVENFFLNEVMPVYANVHTTAGFCAEKTSTFLKQSKDNLRDYCNAWKNYSIIFHGQGTTGAIHKLIELLKIKSYMEFYENLESLASIYKNCKLNNMEQEINSLSGSLNEKDIKVLKEKKYAFDLTQKMFMNLTGQLCKKVRELFEKLFLSLNFCYKEKTKKVINGEIIVENTYKCLLCNIQCVNEGFYYHHESSDEHKKNLKKYYDNPTSINLFQENNSNKIFIDYLDEIIKKKNYYLDQKTAIHDLIQDYQKFKPVIFVSPIEHNSNKLSWKETGAEIKMIQDANELEKSLKTEYKDRYIKIGSFSSTSNVTGLLQDVDEYAIIMHKYKGLAFFDYAAGAPYLKMDMNDALPSDYRKLLNFKELNKNDIKQYCYKDALFFSPHKFPGGSYTPGCLIIHNKICRNVIKPTQAGGGTVNFVYHGDVDYIRDIELKEESGTPCILGSIRVGTMISVKAKISPYTIIKKDLKYNELFMENFQITKNEFGEDVPNIFILGQKQLENIPHIPIYSFVISYDGKLFHPNYICQLLNDLFGIQSRPGCSCAPDYGQELLGFTKSSKFNEVRQLVLGGFEIFKPGFTRLNLSYFYPEYIIIYIIKAIKFVCEYAYLFLGLYDYNLSEGKFSCFKKPDVVKENNNLFDFNDQYFVQDIKEKLRKTYVDVENYVKQKTNLIKDLKRAKEFFDKKRILPDDINKLRWFLLYQDVKTEINNYINQIPDDLPRQKNVRRVDFDWKIHKYNY